MEKVTDLAHFSALVKSARQPGKKTISNCFLLPETINRYIDQQNLTWSLNENGVCFLRECKDLFYLYYYFGEPLCDCKVNLDGLTKPVVLDRVVSEAKTSIGEEQVELLWIENRFEFYKKYLHFYKELPEENRSRQLRHEMDEGLYQFGSATINDISAIDELWRSALDPYSVALPNYEELADLIRSRKIFCIYAKERKVAAVVQIEINGKTATTWHTVVDPQFRGQGLSTVLRNRVYIDLLEVNRIYTWIDEKNTHMIEVDIKGGFLPDGRIDRQFILLPG